MPIQNAGSDNATPAPELMIRDSRPPRTAAVTPSTIPTIPDNRVDRIAMDPVTGSRVTRSSPMEWLSMIDVPRSPWTRPET